MFPADINLLSSFVTPINISTTPASLLWLLPLIIAIAVSYKAIKEKEIKFKHFIKECAILFASILLFIAFTAVVLHLVAWLAT